MRTTAPPLWSWRLVIACAAALTLAGAACSDDPLTSPTSPALLEGTWRLQQTTTAGVHNEDLTANRFAATSGSGTLSLTADCNVCKGATSLSGSTPTVSSLASWLAGCSRAPLDTRFAGLFSGPLTVRIDNRLLQLNPDRGDLRLEK